MNTNYEETRRRFQVGILVAGAGFLLVMGLKELCLDRGGRGGGRTLPDDVGLSGVSGTWWGANVGTMKLRAEDGTEYSALQVWTNNNIFEIYRYQKPEAATNSVQTDPWTSRVSPESIQVGLYAGWAAARVGASREDILFLAGAVHSNRVDLVEEWFAAKGFKGDLRK